jgi:hypothetical protein
MQNRAPPGFAAWQFAHTGPAAAWGAEGGCAAGAEGGCAAC